MTVQELKEIVKRENPKYKDTEIESKYLIEALYQTAIYCFIYGVRNGRGAEEIAAQLRFLKTYGHLNLENALIEETISQRPEPLPNSSEGIPTISWNPFKK